MRLAPTMLLAVVALMGCRKDPPLPAIAVPAHPDLQCPPGTLPAGTAPPQGDTVWCEITNAAGLKVREGPSLEWHPNERRRAEGSYVAGERHGEWLYWYATGSPEARGSYAIGVKEGVWTTYHPNGDRASEGMFVGGAEHGPWVFFDPTSGTRTEGEYVLGERTGPWIDYGEHGRPVRERIYRNGRVIDQREL